MKLVDAIFIYGGGPGSGCRGPNCGRPVGSGHSANPSTPPSEHSAPNGWVRPSSPLAPTSVANRLKEMVKPPSQAPVVEPGEVHKALANLGIIPQDKGPSARPAGEDVLKRAFPSAQHIPNVVKPPKKPREFKENPKHVGGFFRPNTVAARVYNELNSKPNEWFHINDHLMKNFGGQAVITAIYTIKAAGIASGKWDLQREANRVRLVPTLGKTGQPVAPKAVAEANEHYLEEAKIVSSKPAGRGVNGAQIVTFDDGNKGVWKSGSDPEQSNAEVAAWKTAQILGMQDLVPPTVWKIKDGQKGTIQLFRQGKIAGEFGREKYDGIQDASRAATFDYIFGNADRHTGNWIYNPDQKKISLIDHGFLFSTMFTAGMDRGFGPELATREGRDQFAADNMPKPKNMVGPYVDNWDKIASTLKLEGIGPRRISLVKRRLDYMATANRWNDLYKKPEGEEEIAKKEREAEWAEREAKRAAMKPNAVVGAPRAA